MQEKNLDSCLVSCFVGNPVIESNFRFPVRLLNPHQYAISLCASPPPPLLKIALVALKDF